MLLPLHLNLFRGTQAAWLPYLLTPRLIWPHQPCYRPSHLVPTLEPWTCSFLLCLLPSRCSLLTFHLLAPRELPQGGLLLIQRGLSVTSCHHHPIFFIYNTYKSLNVSYSCIYLIPMSKTILPRPSTVSDT